MVNWITGHTENHGGNCKMITHTFKSIGTITGIIVVLFAMICVGTNIACRQMDNVTYEVTGDADSVDVTVSNDNGGQEQYNDVPLPWRMDYGGFTERYVYLYAYNNGDSGTITISIYVNGKLFKTATSSGPYTNAVVYGYK
jgi:hypothetical protein